MAQYLSKYFFEKYEYEAIVSAFQWFSPFRTSVKPESVASIVGYANITLTRLIIIYNSPPSTH